MASSKRGLEYFKTETWPKRSSANESLDMEKAIELEEPERDRLPHELESGGLPELSTCDTMSSHRHECTADLPQLQSIELHA